MFLFINLVFVLYLTFSISFSNFSTSDLLQLAAKETFPIFIQVF